jgi:hypothetical protein
MKFTINLNILMILFIIQACGQNNKNMNTREIPKEGIAKRLYEDVRFLTSIQPARSYENKESLEKVSDYIMKEFRKLKCEAEFQEFKADGKTFRNVIASFGPRDGQRIIVGAHYDVCGDQPGADDNASAVAGLLELARMVDSLPVKPSCRVDFVAYCLEEPPYFATDYMGSAVHAKSLYDNHVPVKLMICLEMIGYFSDKPGSQNFPDPALSKLYPDKGNFIIVVGRTGEEDETAKVKVLMQKSSDIGVESINLPQQLALAGLSDHRNYWKYGYRAVMINDTSFLRNPNYHKKSDTIETLNFDKMAEVVKGVLGAITGI